MTKNNSMRRITFLLGAVLMLGTGSIAAAQQLLTLEQCRRMAVDGNRELEQSRQKVKMAGYDRKIAAANYFPSITATGTYMYNDRNIALIGDDMSEKLTNIGTGVQQQIQQQMGGLMQAVQANPAAAMEYMSSPMWQTFVGALSQVDVAPALNAIGEEVNAAFHPDMTNIYAGVISLKQPVFVGGKIVASNKMARLAEELSRSQYDSQYQDILISVDQTYWQIVELANKKKLAENYADLLKQMEADAEVSVAEGVAVQSDVLTIKVKANEAQMLLCRAASGLALSKMLLCKQIGLPLDSDISLADEDLDAIPQPESIITRSMDEIYADRPETRSLDLASQIYDQKTRIARSEMMPTVALTANYVISNPSCFNGFSNEFGGMFNAGVVVSVPLFHGGEALQKTRKAETEASMCRSRYEDACQMINLQVEQLTRQQQEALEKLCMAESNLESAEENLRVAMAGFEEGVVSTNVTLQAQTAWMQAHSEYIDAGVQLQMNHVNLLKAQGQYLSEIKVENE